MYKKYIRVHFKLIIKFFYFTKGITQFLSMKFKKQQPTWEKKSSQIKLNYDNK